MYVKENIIPVMQAIWSHEPPDQRFFRLYSRQVPWFQFGGRAVTGTRGVAPSALPQTLEELMRGKTPAPKTPVANIVWEVVPSRPRQLIDVADLDNLLGFKGNYMIFPLKESNPLIEFMLKDYPRHDLLGVVDPDKSGNVDAEELEQVMECIEHHEDFSEEDRARYRELLCEELLRAQRNSEVIVVPTGQLFIEALPGKHAVLEEFKLRHRALDEMKVEAEVRAMELENLRLADRLLMGERGDPDVDKVVQINGTAGTNVEA